jgi:hypothetical protein
MTATNTLFEGMTNDAVSVTLSAVAEAVEWTHTLEDGLPKRPTQRVIVYPPSLHHLADVLVSGDPNLDLDDGRPIGRILRNRFRSEVESKCSRMATMFAIQKAIQRLKTTGQKSRMVTKGYPRTIEEIRWVQDTEYRRNKRTR